MQIRLQFHFNFLRVHCFSIVLAINVGCHFQAASVIVGDRDAARAAGQSRVLVCREVLFVQSCETQHSQSLCLGWRDAKRLNNIYVHSKCRHRCRTRPALPS